MRKNKAQERLIRQSVQQAFEVKQAELLKNDDSPPLLPDFEARLQARVDQALSPSRRRLQPPLRILAAAILILLILLFCTGMAPVVSRLIRLIKQEDPQHTNTHYTLTVEGQERKAFELTEFYTLREVPEGFTLQYSEVSPTFVDYLWVRSDNATCISFMQIPLNTLCILSTDGCSEETITLHGREATLYTKSDAQKLVWYTDDCMSVLSFWGPDTQDLSVLTMEEDIVQTQPEIQS